MPTTLTEWFEIVDAAQALAQGDMVPDCPVSIWRADAVLRQESNEDECRTLEAAIEVVRINAVVMTQSCDLAQGRIENVILCPYTPLSAFKENWAKSQKANERSANEKTWKSTCNSIRNGFVWNYSLLNKPSEGQEHLIVGFHEVYTLPVKFLATVLANRREERIRLVSPYREHLAQAFARYFMRVGLPAPIQL